VRKGVEVRETKLDGTIALNLTQWLPKPATSQLPEKRRSLRETWSPGERGQLRQQQVFWSDIGQCLAVFGSIYLLEMK